MQTNLLIFLLIVIKIEDDSLEKHRLISMDLKSNGLEVKVRFKGSWVTDLQKVHQEV